MRAVPVLVFLAFMALPAAAQEPGPDWAPHVVSDGQLITGQNPASSASTAKRLLQQLAHEDRNSDLPTSKSSA